MATLQPIAYAVAYVTFFFGTASIFLRLYCRQVVLKTWGLDDYVAMLILVLSIVQQAVLHEFLYWGCGLHMDTLSSIQQMQIFKWLFIEEIVYYTVHWVIKTAFLFFYLRLTPDSKFRMFVWVGMGLNMSIWTVNVLLACLQCIPFYEILHPGTYPDAVCIPQVVLLTVPAVLNILEDFYILVLPISTVWSLQMSLRRKIAVLGVIGFGSSSVLIACFRLIPLQELNTSPDVSWVLGKMVIVAALEIQFAVVAVNLPSLKSLWTRITGGSSSGSGRGGNSKDKGYKLSSIERNKAGASVIGAGWRKRRISTGSITRLERGITNTESEEELVRHGARQIQGTKSNDGAIQVTTDYSVSVDKEEDEVSDGHVRGIK